MDGGDCGNSQLAQEAQGYFDSLLSQDTTRALVAYQNCIALNYNCDVNGNYYNPDYLTQAKGRVAQAFEFAGTNKTEGAPSFAQSAKGGNHDRIGNGVCAEGQTLCRQHRYPPLQKTQGRGTLCIDDTHEHQQKGRATRPLK